MSFIAKNEEVTSLIFGQPKTEAKGVSFLERKPPKLA